MRKLSTIIGLILLLSAFGTGNSAKAQWTVGGGYSVVMEKAVISNPSYRNNKKQKTTVILHGGHVFTGYNFALPYGFGLRPELGLQMVQLMGREVSDLKTAEGRSLATVVDAGNKEFDLTIPILANYTFDPGDKLHFSVFLGPEVGVTFNEFRTLEYKMQSVVSHHAVRGDLCAFNLQFVMGFEFQMRQFGLRMGYYRDLFSSNHKIHYLKRDMLQVSVTYTFGSPTERKGGSE